MTAGAAPPVAPPNPAEAARQAQAFPRLTPAQIARIEPHGRRRHVAVGEVVGEAGEPVTRIFVVVSGRLDLVRPPRWVGEEVPTFKEGMFTGERSILAGGRFLARIQAGTPCDVIEVGRDALLALIQTDSELSDIFLRAFILRRLQLIDQGFGASASSSPATGIRTSSSISTAMPTARRCWISSTWARATSPS